MDNKTIEAFFRWLKNYMTKNAISDFHVSLHGGEPLLAGKDKFKLIADLRDDLELSTTFSVSLGITTNLLLIDDEWLTLFNERNISFGTSIDGPALYHDRFRRTFNDKGTHREVEEQIIKILKDKKFSRKFSGALCVLHPDMNGKELVSYFYNLGLSKIDLLLPDQNHLHGSAFYPRPNNKNIYSKVLIDAYREWRHIDDPTFMIRKFSVLISAILGLVPTLDSLGTGPITVFTIETNGEIEPVDTMKICGNGATKTGLFIEENFEEDVNMIPLIEFGLQKSSHLPDNCHLCTFLSMCGGGYMPHRFGPNGFEHETIYCSDMKALCDYILVDINKEMNAAKHLSIKVQSS